MVPRIKLEAKALEDLKAKALSKLLIDISKDDSVLTWRIN